MNHPSEQPRPAWNMSAEEFEEAVSDALDSIPERLTAAMDNVVILVEDEPEIPGLLGLYQGVPLTERGQFWAGAVPDTITVYRFPLMRMCSSRAELVHQIRVTVVHEIAHHFGISDERLHQLGWG